MWCGSSAEEKLHISTPYLTNLKGPLSISNSSQAICKIIIHIMLTTCI